MDRKDFFGLVFLALLVGLILAYAFLMGIGRLIAFLLSIFR